MARLRLGKQELARLRRDLGLYRRILPSLDLKRRQLTLALATARRELAAARERLAAIEGSVGADLPMIANAEIELGGLVVLDACELEEENVVGVRLPRLVRLHCSVAPYSLLAKPVWVDFLVDRLIEVAEQRVRVQVADRRARLLEKQERRTTQRVNLFERVLIPRAERDLRRIRVFLGDQERAAIARAKLAKKKQLAARAEAAGAEEVV